MTYQQFNQLLSRLQDNTELSVYARREERNVDLQRHQEEMYQALRELLNFAATRELK